MEADQKQTRCKSEAVQKQTESRPEAKEMQTRCRPKLDWKQTKSRLEKECKICNDSDLTQFLHCKCLQTNDRQTNV